MGLGGTKISTGYGRPPWIFRGSALFQFHLVKAETARAFIPKELRLVEAFGYTLGGFFLAKYEDSPVGVFDELVVIAGIVWNPPTSCAWAAKVFVNSEKACYHGRKEIGLPSRVARFSKKIVPVPRQAKGKFGGFLDMIGLGNTSHPSKDCMDILVTDVVGVASSDIYNIKLTTDVPMPKSNKWMGPSITMSLPSFSGQTEYNPNLLKYSCRLACRVQAVRPAKVSGPSTLKTIQGSSNSNTIDLTTEEQVDNERNLSVSVMLSKPILALQFNCMEMQVETPIITLANSTGSFGTS